VNPALEFTHGHDPGQPIPAADPIMGRAEWLDAERASIVIREPPQSNAT
jgi:hypothetical protein